MYKKLKLFKKINKSFFVKYFCNFLIINLLLFPLAFWQYERAIISVESFLFAFSGKLMILGIFYEIVVSLLASLQVSPRFLLFSFWLSNLNFEFLKTFMEVYAFTTVSIILYLLLHFNIFFKKNIKLFKIFKFILIISLFVTGYFAVTRPLIKYYVEDLSEVQKFDSTTSFLVKNLRYQREVRESSKKSEFLGKKFDINTENLQDYNKIYIFLLESYPIFVNSEINNRIQSPLTESLENFEIKKMYKDWYPDLSTLGQEFYLYCGKDPKNAHLLLSDNDFEDYLVSKKCLINNLKEKGYELNFVHTYKSQFNNRFTRYGYFDQAYFYEDLLKKNFTSSCPWIDVGMCDYQVLDNFATLFDLSKDKSFYFFLSLNGHVTPLDYFIDDKNKKEECNFLALQDEGLCKIFNNQIQINKSINSFVKKNLKSNDILIVLGDTPPMFMERRHKRSFSNNYVPVFTFKKKSL
jgi:hypothetical protein